MTHALRLAALGLLVLFLGAALAPATGPDDGRGDIAGHVAVLRDKGATEDRKEEAVLALLGLGLDGPVALATFTSKEIDRIDKRSEKVHAKVLKSFRKDARKMVEKRVRGKVDAEVQELRKTIIRHATDPRLSKDTIKAESDPALARLTELLTVSVPDVWDAEPKLFGTWSDLLDEVDRASVLARWQGEAVQAMVDLPGGAKAARRFDPEERRFPRTSAELMAGLEQEAVLARLMTDADRRTFETNARIAAELEGELPEDEVRGVRDLNLLRVLVGRAALRLDPKLCNASRGHSEDMVRLGFFAHESPVAGKETPGKRAALAGTSGGAENIYMGSPKPEDANGAWWHSPGHHRNMLGNHSTAGMGRAESHWTQMFG